MHLDTQALNHCHCIVSLSLRVIYHHLIMHLRVPIVAMSMPWAKILWLHKLRPHQPSVRSSPCPSIKGDLNPRISQSAFAQLALLLTRCKFSCGSASSTGEALLVPAVPTAPAAVCGWPNHGAGGSTVGAGETGGVHKEQPSSPEILRISWKLPKLKKLQN